MRSMRSVQSPPRVEGKPRAAASTASADADATTRAQVALMVTPFPADTLHGSTSAEGADALKGTR